MEVDTLACLREAIESRLVELTAPYDSLSPAARATDVYCPVPSERELNRAP